MVKFAKQSTLINFSSTVCVDQTALNVMEILTDAGIRIPEDILHNHFDGTQQNSSRPPITKLFASQ